MKVLLLVLVLGLALSDASPILRQLRRLIHVKRQEEACVSASNNVGQLLENVEMWDRYIPGDMSMEEMLDTVLLIDIFDGSERQNLLCSLDGLATVSEVVSVLDDRGVVQNDVRFLYAYMMAKMRKATLEANEWLRDPLYMSSLARQGLHLESQLTRHLEASMFSSYEPELVDMMMKLISRGFLSMDDYVVPAPSTQPLDQQCIVIANDAIKLWNHQIQVEEQWESNYGDRLRQSFHEWTGLSFGDDDQTRQLICDLLEIVVDGGMDSLYEFLKSEGIIDRLANKGYLYVIQGIEMTRREMEYVAYMNPPPQLTEMVRVIKDGLDNLEAMGLLSLS